MRYLFFIFFLLYFGNAQAKLFQKEINTPKKTIITDSSNIDIRKISAEEIKRYSTQKEFIYTDAAPETLTMWDRFWIWVWKIIRQIFSNKATGPAIKYLVIIIAILGISFIVIKLLGADLTFFSKKSKALDIPFNESLENIHEINFDEQIANAVQNKNYRLAVRLFYLKTLKNLSDKNLIAWLPEKTNQAYVSEIENTANKQEFKALTHQFEYVWYGEFYIEKNNFEIIQESFQQFNQKLG